MEKSTLRPSPQGLSQVVGRASEERDRTIRAFTGSPDWQQQALENILGEIIITTVKPFQILPNFVKVMGKDPKTVSPHQATRPAKEVKLLSCVQNAKFWLRFCNMDKVLSLNHCQTIPNFTKLHKGNGQVPKNRKCNQIRLRKQLATLNSIHHPFSQPSTTGYCMMFICSVNLNKFPFTGSLPLYSFTGRYKVSVKVASPQEVPAAS